MNLYTIDCKTYILNGTEKTFGEEKTVETLNTITIDDTDYTVYRYAPDNNAFHQYDQPTRHEFTIIVE